MQLFRLWNTSRDAGIYFRLGAGWERDDATAEVLLRLFGECEVDELLAQLDIFAVLDDMQRGGSGHRSALRIKERDGFTGVDDGVRRDVGLHRTNPRLSRTEQVDDVRAAFD